MSVLAVDATSIGDWTRPGSHLSKRLVDQIQALKKLGLKPDFVLWQQGEADARQGTSAAEYQQGLHALATVLRQAGVQAPLVLARSTVCRTLPNEEIRVAIEQTVATKPGNFVLGPDTDRLQGGIYRSDGCHFSQAGLKQAAAQWAAVLGPRVGAVLPKPP
jgi:lysophospholipase L1-like esterase